jgi:uncharacterized protein (TIGR02466 family)
MNRNILWSDSFYSFDLSNEIDNDALIEFYQEYRKNNPEGVHRSNRGGWQQPIYPHMDPILDNLFRQTARCVTKVMKSMNAPHTYYSNFGWINSNYKGDYNEAHTHPGSTWAGVYYIKQKPEMGSIVFHRHENFAFARQGLEAERQWDESGKMNDEQFKIDYTYSPRVSEFILFPSWIEHKVTPNTIDEERLNIAFNFGEPEVTYFEGNII